MSKCYRIIHCECTLISTQLDLKENTILSKLDWTDQMNQEPKVQPVIYNWNKWEPFQTSKKTG